MIYDFGEYAGVSADHGDLRTDIQKVSSQASLYNTESQDIVTANRMAREIIQTTGILTDVYIRTDNAKFNSVWDEDADPTYFQPVKIKGYYTPQPMTGELTKWGFDVKLTLEITYARSELFEYFGERMLRIGDVISIPYNSFDLNVGKFRITNAQEFGNFRYTWLYLKCNIENLTGDITVDPTNSVFTLGNLENER